MLARKEKVVAQNNDGILYLFKKNKVTFFHGRRRRSRATATATAGRSTWPAAKPARLRREARDRRHRLEAARAARRVAIDNVLVLDNEGALAIAACRSGWAWSAPA